MKNPMINPLTRAFVYLVARIRIIQKKTRAFFMMNIGRDVLANENIRDGRHKKQ